MDFRAQPACRSGRWLPCSSLCRRKRKWASGAAGLARGNGSDTRAACNHMATDSVEREREWTVRGGRKRNRTVNPVCLDRRSARQARHHAVGFVQVREFRRTHAVDVLPVRELGWTAGPAAVPDDSGRQIFSHAGRCRDPAAADRDWTGVAADGARSWSLRWSMAIGDRPNARGMCSGAFHADRRAGWVLAGYFPADAADGNWHGDECGTAYGLGHGVR